MSDIVDRLRSHIAMMAPHQKERASGKLLVEAAKELAQLQDAFKRQQQNFIRLTEAVFNDPPGCCVVERDPWERAVALHKAAAELKQVLKICNECDLDYNDPNILHALSLDAGNGFVNREELAPIKHLLEDIVDAKEKAIEQHHCLNDLDWIGCVAKTQLAHLEKLIKDKP